MQKKQLHFIQRRERRHMSTSNDISEDIQTGRATDYDYHTDSYPSTTEKSTGFM